MWEKPWTLKEGFLIGGGLIAAGCALQWSVGPVVWDAFAWPVNLLTLVIMTMGLGMIFILRKRIYAFRFLGTKSAATATLGYAVVLTLVMALTRQTKSGIGIHDMLTFWPFVLIYLLLVIILSQVILHRATHFRGWRDVPFFLNHVGLLIALVCATLGSADMKRLKMIVAQDEPEWRAIGPDAALVELPLAVELKKFILEEYDDGSPRRFASDVLVLTKRGKKLRTTIDVNHPVEVEGWKIYQYGYDTAQGAQSQLSILELVRDPWLWTVYVGIGMMLCGAVSLFSMGIRRKNP